MSNLNLPTMTFLNLSTICNPSGRQHTLAYATTAEYVPEDGSTDAYVVIRHHGTVVAEIARGWVFVTNAGFTSQTTRGRIHKILTDNRQDYGFLVLGQNRGDQVLSFASVTPGRFDELTRSFFSAHWDFENRTVALDRSKISVEDEAVIVL